MKKTPLLATVGIFGILFALPGSAHHAFSAEFDANKPITLTGTITSVEWQNPHTWFYIDVKDEAGNVANWGFELASPNLLLRNGWTRNTIKAGDVVTVESFQAKNGKNIANARTVTLTATGQRLLGGASQAGRVQ
jgi:DNA/RNA endonuclease YhcR with UshA esterase domain